VQKRYSLVLSLVDALRSLEIIGKLRVGQTDLDTIIVAAGSDRVVRRVSLPAGTGR
jgi:hypothetical protein